MPFPGRYTLLVFAVFALTIAASRAGDDAGEPGLWPTEWAAFGPVMHQPELVSGGTPQRAALLPGEALTTIPEQLPVGDAVYERQRVALAPGEVFDLDLVGANVRGSTVYLLASIKTEDAVTLRMGAGADWFMQWWLNGEAVYDTLETGNRTSPIAADNHVFELPLQPGENILAAAVIRGSSSFAFAAGDPDKAVRAAQEPSAFDEAMSAAQEAIRPSRIRSGWDYPAVDFKAARGALEQAAARARTPDEKMEALDRLAEVRLRDFHDRDYGGIRALFREIEHLAERDLPSGGTPIRLRAIRRGRAVLGIGRTYLEEGQAARAREAFARVHAARFEAIGGRIPQDHVCGMTSALLHYTEYYTAWSYVQERRYSEARRGLQQLLEREGVTVQHGPGWHARQLLETLRQLPRIRQDRPRMFFNVDTWPAVRERALTTARPHFERMQERVAGYSLEGESIFETWEGARWVNQPEAWGLRTMEAAFVYRMTGDPEVLEKTRRMLRETMDYFLGRVVRSRSYPRTAWLAALDWVWHDLPPPEREALRADLLEYVYTMYGEDWLAGRSTRSTHYYERNVYRYAGMMLLDHDLSDVDYARALAVLSRDAWLHIYGFDVKENLDEGFTDLLTGTLMEYMFAEAQNELWPVLHVWASALGANRIPPELMQVVSPNYLLRNVLGLETGVRHFGYARSWRRAGGTRADLLYDHLAQMIHFFGRMHPEQAGIARHLRERMAAKGLTGTGEFPVFPFLVDLEHAPAAGIPPGMPIARHFEVVGHVLMSSGFGPHDTYALFSAGGIRGEAHYDTTHFTIYRRGYLALDSGTRAMTEAATRNYDMQTVAHNCVLIYMEGETFPGNAVNTGGQRRFPGEAELLAFETDHTFAYMATDATPVYHEDKCAQMVRQFVYLPPDHFVVFDRVTSVRADYPKTWLLHTANEPTIDGVQFSATQDQGRIFCRTLLPADAVLEKIGGPGREFWAGGRNWPIATNVPSSRLRGILDDEGQVAENIGRWRVEVRPGETRKQDFFLHLIQTSDADVGDMVASAMTENGDRVEVQFRVGDREYSVGFRKTGEVGGHIRVRREGETLTDRPFTREVMPQDGLALERPRE